MAIFFVLLKKQNKIANKLYTATAKQPNQKACENTFFFDILISKFENETAYLKSYKRICWEAFFNITTIT